MGAIGIAGRQLRCISLLLVLLIIGGCGGSTVTPDLITTPDQTPTVTAWPVFPPVDAVQPWEQVDDQGYVIPASGRTGSAISTGSEFLPGVERHLAGGDVVSNGEAATINSGPGSLSYAMYRVPLGGETPGVVSLDANLLGGDGYYVGLADYGDLCWHWYGPFSDNHVRLSTAGGTYTSALGSVHVCVVAWDGTAVDLVGVGVDAQVPGDGVPPPVPTAPAVYPVGGGLFLEWLPVAAADLAGYHIYYSNHSIILPAQSGVRNIGYLEGVSRHLLTGLTQATYIRLSAVDITGNESALSPEVSATPLDGSTPELALSISAPSAMLNDTVTLTATGAAVYNFDTDGDGMFDVTGDTTGVGSVGTSATGIIRPAVYATDPAGCVACGGVSLLVASNSRPVACATADPTSGEAPFEVSFSGSNSTDPGGWIVGGGWDFDGDGTYDAWDGASKLFVISATHEYTVPGLYNAKLRVVDNQGAWDVDTVSILVTGLDPGNLAPLASLEADRTTSPAPYIIRFDASASTDSDGSIVLYQWDFDGDGAIEESGPSATVVYTYPLRGWYQAAVTVTDDAGATDTEVLDITLPSEWSMAGMDRRNQRQSPYNGPKTNNLLWSYDLGASVVSGSPVIGADGTIYIGSENVALVALDPDGNELWSEIIGAWIESAPAIAADGTVYFGCGNDSIYAYYPYGAGLRWDYLTGNWVSASPVIADDETLYVGSWDGDCYAMLPNGVRLWEFATGGAIRRGAAVADDGTIYFGSDSNQLYAVNKDGTEKWHGVTGDDVRTAPAIADDGTIYFTDMVGNLFAVSPHGSLVWSFPAGDSIRSSPAIGPDGTIYFGCDDDLLYAVSAEGALKWTFTTGGDIMCSPVVDHSGIVFVGSLDNKMYAINPDGTEKWSFTTGHDIRGSAAISNDGVLYFGSWDTKVYAIGQ